MINHQSNPKDEILRIYHSRKALFIKYTAIYKYYLSILIILYYFYLFSFTENFFQKYIYPSFNYPKMSIFLLGIISIFRHGKFSQRKNINENDNDNCKNFPILKHYFLTFVFLLIGVVIVGTKKFVMHYYFLCVFFELIIFFRYGLELERKNNNILCNYVPKVMYTCYVLGFFISDRKIKNGLVELKKYDVNEFEERCINYMVYFSLMFVLNVFNYLLCKCRIDLSTLKSNIKLYKETKFYFIQKFSHNVRTSLGYMIPFSDDLKDEIMSKVGMIGKDMNNSFENLKHCSADMNNLVIKLSTLANLKRNNTRIRIGTYDLVKLIERYITVQQSLRLREKNQVQLNVQIDRQTFPTYVFCDSFRLGQILGNLLCNAFKYTNKGIIKIYASYNQDDNTFTFIIKDQGRGIEKDKLERIFKPFSCNGDKTSKVNLGLSISKKLSTMLGGTLTISSEGINKGTTACFECKMKESTEKPDEFNEIEIENVNFNEFKYLSILVVEDNKLNQKVMKYFLKKKLRFKHVKFAENGLEALKLTKDLHFDIIFMDIVFNNFFLFLDLKIKDMPIMSGIESTKQMRKNGNKTFICAVTATSDLQKLNFCYNNMNITLSKPVKLEDIIKVVRMCINNFENKRITINQLKKENNDLDVNKLREKNNDLDVNQFEVGSKSLGETKVKKVTSYSMFKDTLVRGLIVGCGLHFFSQDDTKFFTVGMIYIPMKLSNIFLEYFLPKRWKLLCHIVCNYFTTLSFYYFFGKEFTPVLYYNMCLNLVDLINEQTRRGIFISFAFSLLIGFTVIGMDFISYDGYISFTPRILSYSTLITQFIAISSTIRAIFRVIEVNEKEEKETIEVLNVLNSEKEEQNNLCAKVSHDLIIPIKRFIKYLEKIRETLKNKHGIVEEKKFEELMFCAMNIKRLTSNLVYFYNLKHNKIQINPAVVKIQKMISEIVEYQESTASKGNINLIITTTKDLPTECFVDKVIVGEIISKIVQNAFKYIEFDKGKIEINCFDDKKRNFHVVVEDNGIGIDKEKLKRIFNPFTNLYSTKSQKPSSSLRLLICAELAKIIGGDLVLTSSGINKGTRCHFHFPFRTKVEKINMDYPEFTDSIWLKTQEVDSIVDNNKRNANNIPNNMSSSIRVLFVDDDSVLTKVFGLWLKKLGLKDFVLLNNRNETFEQISTNKFDLIFLDYQLNVLEILDRIEEYKRKKIILTTDDVLNEKEIELINDYGVFKIIHKPLKYSIVAENIHLFINKKKKNL